MSEQRASQLIEAGLWLRLSGDLEGARRLFEQALRLDPGNARARQLIEASRTAEMRAAHGEVTPSAPPPTSATALVAEPDPAAFNPFDRREPVATPTPPLGAGGSPGRLGNPMSLIHSDWAMATGMLDERMKPTPPSPKVVVSPEAFVPASSRTAAPLAPPPVPAPHFDVPAPSSTLSYAGGSGGALALESAWEAASGPAEQISLTPGGGEAMDLVVADATPPRPPSAPSRLGDPVALEVAALLQSARDRLELDDHSGAMELITQAHALSPKDPEVEKLKRKSEQTLLAMFESKIGALERKPRVRMRSDEIIWLNLDHRAGFVLAQIDGTVTLEDVFAVSGMSRLDTARILSQLFEQGVIA